MKNTLKISLKPNEKIYLNGGRRGYLIGLAPQVVVDQLGAKPVTCALAES